MGRVALAVVLLAAAAARAEEPRRELRVTLGGSVNPPGVQNGIDLSWRWKLGDSEEALHKDAHFSVGVSSRLSPAYERLGGWVEVSPLSILDLRVGFEPVVYFGTFGVLVDYPSYAADFSKKVRDATRDRAISGTGRRLYAAPTLKLKAGSVVAVAGAEFEWWDVDAPGAFFYEPTRDTLLDSESDAMAAGQALLLWERGGDAGRKLLLGGSYTQTRVYDAPENRIQKAGLVGIWVLGTRRFGMGEPTLYANVFRYLEDPSKEDDLGAAFAVGFTLGR